MSDVQLRNLERCWKETGSSEDEAAYLIGRVRFGSLHLDFLIGAANRGHKAARLALGIDGPPPKPAESPFQWYPSDFNPLSIEELLRHRLHLGVCPVCGGKNKRLKLSPNNKTLRKCVCCHGCYYGRKLAQRRIRHWCLG